MLEARWQSQSANPMNSQSGRTKYIKTLRVTSASMLIRNYPGGPRAAVLEENPRW